MVDELLPALNQWVEVCLRHSMKNLIHFIRENGLSMSQMRMLMQLSRKGSCGVSGIGEHLGVTSAAASQLIDRLVQQELILRSEDPDDRRLKQIILTEKGQEMVREGIRLRQGWLEELNAMLSPGEQQQVSAALKILMEKTHQLDPPSEFEI